MIGFIAMRLVQSVVVMLTVALIAFALFRFVGDPINNLVGQDTTLEERAALKERLGLNDSFAVQFARFAANGHCPDRYHAFDWNTLAMNADHPAALANEPHLVFS